MVIEPNIVRILMMSGFIVLPNNFPVMKKKLFCLLWIGLALIVCQCRSTREISGVTAKVVDGDSTAYELMVMDAGYELFLASEAKPMNFYSNEYYSSWNTRYVTEWNIRCRNTRKYGLFYITTIDYSPNIDYGIELNYRLYNYFLFIQKHYQIQLIPRGATL